MYALMPMVKLNVCPATYVPSGNSPLGLGYPIFSLSFQFGTRGDTARN